MQSPGRAARDPANGYVARPDLNPATAWRTGEEVVGNDAMLGLFEHIAGLETIARRYRDTRQARCVCGCGCGDVM